MVFYYYSGTLTYCRFSVEQSFEVLEDDDGTPVVVSPFTEAPSESMVELDIVEVISVAVCPEVCFRPPVAQCQLVAWCPASVHALVSMPCIALIFACYTLYICIVVVVRSREAIACFAMSPQVYCHMWKVYTQIHLQEYFF